MKIYFYGASCKLNELLESERGSVQILSAKREYFIRTFFRLCIGLYCNNDFYSISTIRPTLSKEMLFVLCSIRWYLLEL